MLAEGRPRRRRDDDEQDDRGTHGGDGLDEGRVPRVVPAAEVEDESDRERHPEADEEHREHVDRHGGEASEWAHRVRFVGGGDVLAGDERRERREGHAQRRTGGVGDEVVDVEEAVGARVDEPVAGELGELDEEREPEPGGDTRPRPPLEGVAQEDAQGGEEGDVEDGEAQPGVTDDAREAARVHLPDELERHELRPEAAVADELLEVGQREDRVGPQRHEVEDAGSRDEGAARAGATGAEAPRDVGDEDEGDGDEPQHDREDCGSAEAVHGYRR